MDQKIEVILENIETDLARALNLMTGEKEKSEFKERLLQAITRRGI